MQYVVYQQSIETGHVTSITGPLTKEEAVEYAFFLTQDQSLGVNDRTGFKGTTAWGTNIYVRTLEREW